MASVKLTFDQAAVRSVIGGQSRAATRRAAKKTADRCKANVYASGRVKTGRMARSFRTTDVASDPLAPSVGVWSDVNYTQYQERGTRYISPAWFMRRALAQLSVSDFLP